MSGKTKERKKGALWDKKPEESGGKGLMDMLRKKKKKNTGTIRQMKKQDLGYREEKMAERRRRKQSNL